jgi:hypothetical protein
LKTLQIKEKKINTKSKANNNEEIFREIERERGMEARVSRGSAM